MTTVDYAALLERAVQERDPQIWNAWRLRSHRPATTPDIALPALDLSSAHLPGVNLAGMRLLMANVSLADLSGAVLERSDLSGVHASGATLAGASLAETDLTDAYLARADLRRADLTGAQLSGADLRGANLAGAVLRRADISETDLSGAVLVDADLTSARLVRAVLDQARLGGTIFECATLRECRGLESIVHLGPSVLDHETLDRSPTLPLSMLQGVGLPDWLIEAFAQPHARTATCLIVHSPEDAEFAQLLYDRLQDRGLRCWLDERPKWPTRLGGRTTHRGQDLTITRVVCCSRSSFDSRWLDRGRLRHDDVAMADVPSGGYVAIALDGSLRTEAGPEEPAPLDRANVVADFTGWEDDPEVVTRGLEHLVDALV